MAGCAKKPPPFPHRSRLLQEDKLAKPNFQFEKRQKELEKKKKKEEKKLRKLDKSEAPAEENPEQPPPEGETEKT